MRGFRERTSVADALALLERRTGALEPEEVAAVRGRRPGRRRGRPRRGDVPHFARAAMDGFAVVGESTFGATAWAPVDLELVGSARPGRPFQGAVRERAGGGDRHRRAAAGGRRRGDHGRGRRRAAARGRRSAVVRVVEPIPPGKNVGALGEDVRAGEVVVRAAACLRPQDVGVLASVGVGALGACPPPARAGRSLTGDELLPPGRAPEGARIVDANGPMLAALARRDGAAAVRVEYVEDRRAASARRMARADEDVLLVSGGSSRRTRGPRAQRAGRDRRGRRPWRRHAPFEPRRLRLHRRRVRCSCLPGNPVSCLCAYEFFAGPTIRALGGRSRDWPHPRARGPARGQDRLRARPRGLRARPARRRSRRCRS